jgi:hypothetical protein
VKARPIPLDRLQVLTTVRWLVCLVLMALAVEMSAATDEPLPGRVGLTCDLLMMGRAGTRQLASRRLVLEPGMGGRVRFDLPARSTGGEGPMEISLSLVTGALPGGRMAVDVDGEMTEKVPDAPRTWQVQRRVEILMGTSALVELGPPDEDGQRLALTLTAAAAVAGESVDASRLRVDLNVEVAVVDGDEAHVLEHPHLRSLSGETVAFGVDYQVPSTDGRSFENVHLQLELTPGFVRGLRLPLQISIAGGFPGPDGIVFSSRSDSRLLASGEVWEMAIRPPDEESPWLRVRLIAGWRSTTARGSADGS